MKMVCQMTTIKRTVFILLPTLCLFTGLYNRFSIKDVNYSLLQHFKNVGEGKKPPTKLSEVFRQENSKNYTNLLDVDPPQYLQNFKTPCWWEDMENPPVYKGNPMTGFIGRKQLDILSRIFQKQYQNGGAVRLRCLPYFHLVGFPKCGTTDLYHMLESHALITSTVKENYFWAEIRNGVLAGGKYAQIKHYVDLFDFDALEVQRIQSKDPNTGELFHPTLIGDGSTHTAYSNARWSKLPENAGSPDGPRYFTGDYIYHITPQARIIIIYRNPTERMFSDYIHRGGSSTLDFHKTAERVTARVKDCLKYHSEWACVNNNTLNTNEITRGIYPATTERWLRTFPSNQIHTCFFEDYVKDQFNVTNTVFSFLGLDLMTIHEFDASRERKIKNNFPGKKFSIGKMLPKSRDLLNDFFQPFNKKLAEILHSEKALWHIKRTA